MAEEKAAPPPSNNGKGAGNSANGAASPGKGNPSDLKSRIGNALGTARDGLKNAANAIRNAAKTARDKMMGSKNNDSPSKEKPEGEQPLLEKADHMTPEGEYGEHESDDRHEHGDEDEELSLKFSPQAASAAQSSPSIEITAHSNDDVKLPRVEHSAASPPPRVVHKVHPPQVPKQLEGLLAKLDQDIERLQEIHANDPVALEAGKAAVYKNFKNAAGAAGFNVKLVFESPMHQWKTYALLGMEPPGNFKPHPKEVEGLLQKMQGKNPEATDRILALANHQGVPVALPGYQAQSFEQPKLQSDPRLGAPRMPPPAAVRHQFSLQSMPAPAVAMRHNPRQMEPDLVPKRTPASDNSERTLPPKRKSETMHADAPKEKLDMSPQEAEFSFNSGVYKNGEKISREDSNKREKQQDLSRGSQGDSNKHDNQKKIPHGTQCAVTGVRKNPDGTCTVEVTKYGANRGDTPREQFNMSAEEAKKFPKDRLVYKNGDNVTQENPNKRQNQQTQGRRGSMGGP